MSNFFMGQIQTFAFIYAPRDWALCGGQSVAIAQQQALYSLIGNFYGGDGRVTFQYPGLTSRAPVGFNMGGGVGLTPYQIGTFYGFEQVSMGISQMPTHTHTAAFTPTGGSAVNVTVEATTEDGESASPSNDSYLATTVPGPAGPDQPEKIYRNTTPTVGSLVSLGGVAVSGGSSGGGTVTVGNKGSGQAIENRMPFQAINFSICMDGIYPPRN